MNDIGNLNILFISHRLPFPPNKGDKIRAFNILNFLQKKGHVHLAALVDDGTDLEYLDAAKARCKSLSVSRIDTRVKEWSAIKALFRASSISQQHFYTAELQEKIDNLLREQQFDVIFCSSSPTAEYVFQSRAKHEISADCRTVMDFIDIDSVKWRQYAESSSLIMRLIYRREADKLAAFERRIGEAFDALLVVSEKEAELFPCANSKAKLEALGNGVDLDFFRPELQVTPDRNTLVFVGMMDYRPNIDGMQWFLDKVFPAVKAAVPDCRVLVVGGRPVDQVRRWSTIDGVTVTGFVDDVRTFVHRGAVSIVPLLIARGIQNKVLESMAMGKAIVATPQAIEGIDAVPGEEVIVAADARAFADSIVQLLNDPERVADLGRAARNRAQSTYSWDQRLSKLDTVIGRADDAIEPSTGSSSSIVHA